MVGSLYGFNNALTKLLILAGILLLLYIITILTRKNVIKKRFFVYMAILIQMVYLAWRVGFTIPPFPMLAIFFGILLLIAEGMAAVQTLTHRLMFLHEYQPEEIGLEVYDQLPTVDILIATYNEPVEILENTIATATSQRYPHDKYKVYVCDDGARPAVGKLAEDYGAIWVTRPDNAHAKAGNLNHCLKNHASGELFAVLDADMITKTSFLERMVGYFIDPDMAMVQAPQVFYNPDPFQNNLLMYSTIPNEQDFFMREVLTRRNQFNAVLNVGSNAIFRRTHVESIGWIPTGTITEDMATSMLLQAHGYTTLFINETLAMGLSPETFVDYIKQRDRWCRGNIQVMKKWKPLRLKGLSAMQRLIYFDGVLYWFFGFQKLIYIIGPILLLLFGLPIYYSDVFTMLLFFMPMYFLTIEVFSMFEHKTRTINWAHLYETALAPYLAFAALSELFISNKMKFSVTPKGKKANRIAFQLRVAWPHILMAVLSLVALGFGIFHLVSDVIFMIPVYLVNIFWLLYNMVGITVAILLCFEQPRLRQSERFQVHEQVSLKIGDRILPTKILDISFNACALQPFIDIEEPDLLVGQHISVVKESEGLDLPGVVFRSRGWGKRLIINFEGLNKEQHTMLVNYIIDRQENGFGGFEQRSFQVGETHRRSLSDQVRKMISKA